jgi:hypothetical protein
MNPAGVGAADGTRCGRSGDRQVNGQVVNVESGIDKAAPSGSLEEFE